VEVRPFPGLCHIWHGPGTGRSTLPPHTRSKPTPPSSPRLATSTLILHTSRVRTGLARAPSAGPNGGQCAPSWWRGAWRWRRGVGQAIGVGCAFAGRKAPVWGRVRARGKGEGIDGGGEPGREEGTCLSPKGLTKEACLRAASFNHRASMQQLFLICGGQFVVG